MSQAVDLASAMARTFDPRPARAPAEAPVRLQSLRSPLAGWPGGKYRLAKRLVARMPPHVLYAEPFCGAAWLLFSKSPAKREIINDRNGEIVNFYRVMRDRLPELLEKFRWTINSREEFARLRDMDPAEIAKLDDISRAWRFYYILINCFGGRLDHPAFATDGDGHAGKSRLSRLDARLLAARERLRDLIVENLDFEAFICRYDRPEAFFYIDPPFYGQEGYYGKNLFCRQDFGRLAESLRGLKGKFLLSINDLPQTREIFGGFAHLESLPVNYSLAEHKTIKASELVIANYQPPALA